MTYRCLVIDDEPWAHAIVKKYAQKIPTLTIVQHCYDPFEAIPILNTQAIDLLFLDIEMPQLSGLIFIKTLTMRTQIILITAYREYALEGFELDVCDYLLKPVSFERFLRAVNKATHQLPQNALPYEASTLGKSPEPEPAFIFLKENKKIHQVDIENILYLESCGNYVKVHLVDQLIFTLDSLKNLETLLPAHLFVRIHKSYLVSRKKIKLIEGNQVLIHRIKLPIGAIYKMNLMKWMSGDNTA